MALFWDDTIGPYLQARISAALAALGSLPLPTGAATELRQHDGTQKAMAMGVEGANQRQVAVDAAGKLTVVESSAADILAAINKEADTSVDITWTLEDGTHEVEIPLPASWVNCCVDVVGAWGIVSASAGGAATWQLLISHTSGFTPGDNSNRYTSAATAVASKLSDPIPFTPAQFYVGATPKLYARIPPNVGTTTGSASIRVHRHR